MGNLERDTFSRLIAFKCVLCKFLAKRIVLDNSAEWRTQRATFGKKRAPLNRRKLKLNISCLCHIQTPALTFPSLGFDCTPAPAVQARINIFSCSRLDWVLHSSDTQQHVEKQYSSRVKTTLFFTYP